VRRLLTIAACVVLALPAAAALTRMGLVRMPSVYRDARMGIDVTATNQNRIQFRVEVPPGRHSALTVTAWLRLKPETAGNHLWTTYAFWCPDSIDWSNPDLLAGAGGYGAGGTNLTAAGGSVTMGAFPFASYADHPDVAGKWPRGVYTIAGTAEQAVTVTLGGTDVAVGPGPFNVNAVPGPSDSVVITGAGVAEVGICRTPCHRFYSAIDGVQDGNKWTRDSIVTNEIAMCTWRFRCDGGQQIYKSDLGRIGAFDDLSITQTNGACGGYSGDGFYEVGLMGLGEPIYPMTYDLYDARVFTWWLSDDELDRVHLNGVQEIGRRGIPQWR
jgi:hypothetical protein